MRNYKLIGLDWIVMYICACVLLQNMTFHILRALIVSTSEKCPNFFGNIVEKVNKVVKVKQVKLSQ
jgi:hypothetical protein